MYIRNLRLYFMHRAGQLCILPRAALCPVPAQFTPAPRRRGIKTSDSEVRR